MNRSVTLALLLIAASGAAQALDTQTAPQSVDLQIVYDHALTQDPIYQQAEALHMATRETKTQAILDLLPLDANVSQTWNGRNSDNTLIMERLGWAPSVSLRSGLEKTYQWIYDEIARTRRGVARTDVASHSR